MKQTQNTNACSLAKEGAAAYSLVRRVAAAVTGESGGGSVLSGTRGKLTAVSRARDRARYKVCRPFSTFQYNYILFNTLPLFVIEITFQ